MKRKLMIVLFAAALAAHAGAQGVVYGDIAFAGSVYTTNAYGAPAGVYGAARQGGAWTNDGAFVWYRLAATNRHGRSGWVYSTNAVVLNVATGRQSATVSWTNALGGVAGFLLQRRSTTNFVANPAGATNNALWTRWQSLSVKVGTVLDLSWTNWSTNAWADLPAWGHARSYPWATADALQAETAARIAGDDAGTNFAAGLMLSGTVARATYSVSTLFSTNSGYAAAAGRASMLGVTGGNIVLSVTTNGLQVTKIMLDTNRVYIASASEDFNGPAVGTVLYAILEAESTWISNGVATVSWTADAWQLSSVTPDAIWSVSDILLLPQTFNPDEAESFGTCVIDYVPVTNITYLVDEPTVIMIADTAVDEHNADTDAHPTFARTSDLTAAPAWQGITNLSASVTVTNLYERPVYLASTGAVSLTFAGLRPPAPLYLVVAGPSSLTIPGAYFVGGGSWQTNRANHFLVWQQGTNLLANAITTTEI